MIDKKGLYIFIRGDINDGDYVSEFNIIKNDEDGQLLLKLGKALQEKEPRYGVVRNFNMNSDCRHYPYYQDEFPQFNEDEWERLFEYLPTSGDYPIHSINKFVFVDVYDTLKLF